MNLSRQQRRAVKAYTDKRDAVMRNPTNEGALRFWNYELLGPTARPDAPLAGVHKARLQWTGATEAMKAESRAWLREHGYSVSSND